MTAGLQFQEAAGAVETRCGFWVGKMLCVGRKVETKVEFGRRNSSLFLDARPIGTDALNHAFHNC